MPSSRTPSLGRGPRATGQGGHCGARGLAPEHASEQTRGHRVSGTRDKTTRAGRRRTARAAGRGRGGRPAGGKQAASVRGRGAAECLASGRADFGHWDHPCRGLSAQGPEGAVPVSTRLSSRGGGGSHTWRTDERPSGAAGAPSVRESRLSERAWHRPGKGEGTGGSVRGAPGRRPTSGWARRGPQPSLGGRG